MNHRKTWKSWYPGCDGNGVSLEMFDDSIVITLRWMREDMDWSNLISDFRQGSRGLHKRTIFLNEALRYARATNPMGNEQLSFNTSIGDTVIES